MLLVSCTSCQVSGWLNVTGHEDAETTHWPYATVWGVTECVRCNSSCALDVDIGLYICVATNVKIVRQMSICISPCEPLP